MSRVKRLSSEQREWASGAICDALSGISAFTSARAPFIFLGSEGEPDTEEIVGLALMLERKVSVPRVSGQDMKAVRITPYTNFKRNKWGILEPVGGAESINVDVAIVPLVAFDGLNRAGHGGGFYDRFLSARECFKIGIAFDCQRVENLECDERDVPMDMVVTERRIITPYGESENTFGVEI